MGCRRKEFRLTNLNNMSFLILQWGSDFLAGQFDDMTTWDSLPHIKVPVIPWDLIYALFECLFFTVSVLMKMKKIKFWNIFAT